MKKQLILIVVACVGALPACAQYMGPHILLTNPQHNRVMDQVSRYVQQAAVHTQDWTKLVQREERRTHRNGPLGTSFYALTTPSFEQKPVTQQPALYQERFYHLQRAIGQNPTLKNYTLAVPDPADLVNIGRAPGAKWTFEDLLRWMRNVVASHQMECSKRVPGVVGISFTNHHTQENGSVKREVEFNLWIDVRTRTVYVLDNGQYYGE